jgi:hypothetical protein
MNTTMAIRVATTLAIVSTVVGPSERTSVVAASKSPSIALSTRSRRSAASPNERTSTATTNQSALRATTARSADEAYFRTTPTPTLSARLVGSLRSQLSPTTRRLGVNLK